MTGFSFGSAAVNPAPSGGFSFGAKPEAAAPAASTTNVSAGFSFGGSAAPTPAPAATTVAAPSTGGFSFGGAASSAAGTATTPAAPTAAPSLSSSSGFSFGGKTPAPSTGTAPNATSEVPSSASPGEVCMTIPSFESIFPYLSLNRRIRKACDMLQDESTATQAERLLQGHELREILKNHSSKLMPNSQTLLGNESIQPNVALRQKLASPNAMVHLHGKPTGLTHSILQDITHLADELHLEESHAAALYAGASDASTRAWLENNLDTSFCHSALNNQKKALQPLSFSSINHAAKELYFYERSCCISTILLLLQHRVYASSILSNDESNEEKIFAARNIVESTDYLLTQHDLINGIMKFIREVSLKCEKSIALITNAILTAEASSNVSGIPMVTPAPQKAVRDIDYVFLTFSFQQRQLASECVFYLSYNTQYQTSEVATLLDLIKDLTNDDASGGIGHGLPQLDPLKDVPDPYLSPSHNATNISPNFQQQRHSQQYPAVKSNGQWQEELIASLWSIPGMTNVATLTGYDYTGNWIMSKASKIPGGRPQLLQCVSILVLAGICALDTNCLLLDRETHTFNSFGEGNALYRQNTSKLNAGFEDIHLRLDPNVDRYASWNRQDIVGLLSAAYGLLLRPTASMLNSPQTHSQHSPFANIPSPSFRDTSIDIKATFRSCLEIPTVNKSLTFARFTLLPSLGFSSRCNSLSFANNLDSDYAFFMSVLSTFCAQYLDVICTFGELPISRAQWLSDEEKELQVRHVQEEQRRQFGAWSGQTYTSQVPLPTEVDIMRRPDCIDDVIALGVSICTACPDCASQFWSTISDEFETDCFQLEPSKVVQKLERLQSEDISILPAYLTFLAAISLAESPDNSHSSLNGATVVFRLLSNTESSSASPGTISNKNMTWYYILNAIRRYADELFEFREVGQSRTSSVASSVGGMGRMNASVSEMRRSTATTSESQNCTSYYYGADNYTGFGSDGVNDSRNLDSSRNTDQSSTKLKQSTNGGRQKAKELSEIDKSILLSLLVLLSNVCLKSSEARFEILEMKLPVTNNSTFGIGLEDDILSILFSLLVTDIDPDIRGAIFVAIANLLRYEDFQKLSTSEKEKVSKYGQRGWELLDACQIIPISILDQYTHIQNGKISALPSDYSSPNFFNPQNQSNMNTNQSNTTSWFSPSKQYGILHEMEHVEYRNGVYPSTEGFLYLLNILFSNFGSPPNLGARYRPRPGCSPYIEYVLDFVIQRIMATKRNDKGLFFATSADRCRLLSRALEVIDAVLFRYMIPPTSNNDGARNNIANFNQSSNFLSHSADTNNSEGERIREFLSHHESTISSASEEKGLSLVSPFLFTSVEKLELSGEDAVEYKRDYSDETIKLHPEQQNDTQANGPFQIGEDNANMFFDASGVEVPGTFPLINSRPRPPQTLTQPIPRPKSPGFYILSDLLSSSENSLFHILSRILLENENARGIHALYGDAVHSKSLAFALYGDLTPAHGYVKKGRDHLLYQQKVSLESLQISSMNSSFIQSSMQSLYSSSTHGYYESSLKGKELFLASKHDAVFWRERNIFLVLRILCAAVGREDSFIHATNSSSSPLNMVPVIHFKPLMPGSLLKSGLKVKHVKVTRLSNLILGTSGTSALFRQSIGLASVLTQYVGYRALNDNNDQNIANFAMSLITYLTRMLPQSEVIRALCGKNMDEQKYIAKSIANRLSLPSKKDSISSQYNAKRVILDLLLSNIMHQNSVGDDNLSHILLGLSGKNLLEKNVILQSMRKVNFEMESRSNENCLDSILDLISDLNFILDAETSCLASKCYELIYRLCKSSHNVGESGTTTSLIRMSVMEKLRSRDFWVKNLDRFLSETSNSSNSLLHLLVSSCSSSEESDHENPMSHQRDHDVLHCLSWLLRGISVELHSLLALDASPASLGSNNPYMSAPKITQCKRLLDYLYGKQHSFIYKILIEIPLTTPAVVRYLNDAPSQEFIHSVSCALDGPLDVFGGYKIVDIELLRSRIKQAKNDLVAPFSTSYEEGAVKWAEAWNAYVSYVCAASHLSSSWNDVLRTSTLCCRSLLFESLNKRHTSGDILGKIGLIDIVRTILCRLNEPSRNGLIDPKLGSSSDMEASVVLPLSMSVLNLIGLLSDLISTVTNDKFIISRQNSDDRNDVYFDVEDLVKIAELIMGAIEVCSYGGRSVKAYHDERAASLSLSLSMILSKEYLLSGRLPLPSNLANSLRIRAIHSGRHLSKLAGLSACRDDVSDSLKSTGISLAARSGLSSILTFLSSQSKAENDSTIRYNFLTEIFSDKNFDTKSGCNLRRLTHLLASFDTDVSSTLETIVSCDHGAELIYHAGATEALLSSGKQYVNEILTNSGATSMDRENYGSIIIDPPNFLNGHLSLLNSMLSADSNESVKQGILMDSARFLQSYFPLIEKLITSYPNDCQLLIQFAKCAYMTSSGLNRFNRGLNYSTAWTLERTEDVANDFSSVFGKELCCRLEQRMCDLVYHLAEFPFPSKFLPTLPPQLRSVRRTLFSQMKYGSAKISNGRSWWDLIKHVEDSDKSTAIVLPDPPTGSFDANSSENYSIKLGRFEKYTNWCDENYFHASSSATCLEFCLMFLCSQISAQNSNLNVDNISLSIGLCRCADASRAIEDRLKKMGLSEEREMSTLFSQASLNSNNNNMSAQIKSIEKNALSFLGPKLGRCTENLLYLIYINAFRLLADGSRNHHSEIAETILPALEHTQIETMGIGCTGLSNGSEQAKGNNCVLIAEKLRGLLK